MNNKKLKIMRKIITICALAFIGANGFAQMKDVTVTLQPTASYNWFDKNTAIEDGVLYGARVGFGFGEAIELRGVYEKSADLRNSVDGLDFLSTNFKNNFASRKVDIERFGGEFKANIPTRGVFVPYLTLGAGVQKLTVDVAATNAAANNLKSEQIYLNLGLGTQIRLGERLFLNLEAKNTVFNLDPASVLYQDGQNQSDVAGWLNDNSNTRMYNWSALAGLQLYLGGRSPEQMSSLDRAYRNKFSGGSGKFKLVIEPAGAYVNFDNDTNLRDSYFLGGKAGFDLNNYVGIRGFYYQATKNEQVSFDFDKLAMYGGEFVGKLNVSRGLVPYITVGGGYLNAYGNNYVGKDGLTGATSGYFAKGGLGLNIPLSRSLEVFGDANLLYTSQRAADNLQNIVSPSELKTHTMYGVGLRFQLGNKADDTERILNKEIDQRVDDRTKMYQDRIDDLESELSDAYKNNDTKKAVRIIEEKKDLERKRDDDKDRDYQDREDNRRNSKSDYQRKDSNDYQSKDKNDNQRKNKSEDNDDRDDMKSSAKNKSYKKDSRVEMSPKELEELIDKVIQGVDQDSRKTGNNNDRMDRLERLLLEINTGSYKDNLTPARQEDASQRILDKLNDLDKKIDKNSERINNFNSMNQGQNPSQDKTIVINSGQQNPAQQQINPLTSVTTDQNGKTTVTTDDKNKGTAVAMVVKEGFSAFTGIAIANEVSWVLGVRGHYAFTNSSLVFMPDLYLAPGKNTGFGVNANVVLPFDGNKGAISKPYVGLGLGYNDAAGESTFSPNLVLGTSFNVLDGKLYADYTAHGFFKIHVLSIGYKLNF